MACCIFRRGSRNSEISVWKRELCSRGGERKAGGPARLGGAPEWRPVSPRPTLLTERTAVAQSVKPNATGALLITPSKVSAA